MKTFIITLTLALICCSAVFAQKTSPKSKNTVESNREKFDPTKNPVEDLKTAIAQAQKENKRIVLDVGGEWCVWCIKMDKFIAANKNLKEMTEKNFLWVKVNMSEENENKPFLSSYPAISGYPFLFVLEKDGTLLHAQDTSELEEAEIPMIVPGDVKDKEKAMKDLEAKRKARGYDLQKFTDFVKKWSVQ